MSITEKYPKFVWKILTFFKQLGEWEQFNFQKSHVPIQGH